MIAPSSARFRIAIAALSLAIAACSDKIVTSSPVPPPPPSRAAQLGAPDAGPPPMKVSAMDFGENDFVESDRNRDPFRSFAGMFAEQSKKPTVNQRAVVLAQYSIDELKLVAIVLSADYPRAMLVDPGGKGWVVKRGDFIGRPDVVHTGGSNGADYQLNWRVERVRQGELVLQREDPAQPGIPPATRVIPLHTEPEANLTLR